MTERTISPPVDQADERQAGSGFGLIPWRRPSILAPFVDAVFAARSFFTQGTDDVPAKEPMEVPVASTAEKARLRSVAPPRSSARLDAAVRRAASAKAKAREAKAALKKSKKAFRLARKAAKAARKEVDALQAAIARAEERAAVIAKRARTNGRVAKPDASAAVVSPAPQRPAASKPRKIGRAAASTPPDADVVYTEPLVTPSNTSDGSPPSTDS